MFLLIFIKIWVAELVESSQVLLMSRVQTFFPDHAYFLSLLNYIVFCLIVSSSVHLSHERT